MDEAHHGLEKDYIQQRDMIPAGHRHLLATYSNKLEVTHCGSFTVTHCGLHEDSKGQQHMRVLWALLVAVVAAW